MHLSFKMPFQSKLQTSIHFSILPPKHLPIILVNITFSWSKICIMKCIVFSEYPPHMVALGWGSGQVLLCASFKTSSGFAASFNPDKPGWKSRSVGCLHSILSTKYCNGAFTSLPSPPACELLEVRAASTVPGTSRTQMLMKWSLPSLTQHLSKASFPF